MLHDEAHGETSFQMLLVYEDPLLSLKSDNGPHCGGRSNKATNGQISRSYQAIEQTAVARMLRLECPLSSSSPTLLLLKKMEKLATQRLSILLPACWREMRNKIIAKEIIAFCHHCVAKSKSQKGKNNILKDVSSTMEML